MAAFDEYIEETNTYVEGLRARGRQVRERYPGNHASPPFKIGPGASPGIVMKSDTFLELGSPATGSCAFALYTDHAALVQDNRIRLIGPDVQESPSATLSFGQIIMVAGETLTDQEFQLLIQSQYVGDQIEGYMVKSTPGHIWTRVSRAAAGKGFCFGFLGMALIQLVKARIPGVTAAEIIFVTSDKADVQLLGEINARVSGVAREIKARLWSDRGINIAECAFGGHCGSCDDKAVCDEVNKIAHARKKISQEHQVSADT